MGNMAYLVLECATIIVLVELLLDCAGIAGIILCWNYWNYWNSSYFLQFLAKFRLLSQNFHPLSTILGRGEYNIRVHTGPGKPGKGVNFLKSQGKSPGNFENSKKVLEKVLGNISPEKKLFNISIKKPWIFSHFGWLKFKIFFNHGEKFLSKTPES